MDYHGTSMEWPISGRLIAAVWPASLTEKICKYLQRRKAWTASLYLEFQILKLGYELWIRKLSEESWRASNLRIWKFFKFAEIALALEADKQCFHLPLTIVKSCDSFKFRNLKPWNFECPTEQALEIADRLKNLFWRIFSSKFEN